MARKLFIPLSAAVAGALITASPASAVTCEGLQDALDAAPAGSVVTVDEGSTCTGTLDLPSRPITLQGAGSGATLTGDREVRILRGDDVGQTVIRNLRFTDGRDDGDGGGAILVTGNSPITVESSSFTGNDAEGPGGAIHVNAFGGFENPERAKLSSEAPHVVIRTAPSAARRERRTPASPTAAPSRC